MTCCRSMVAANSSRPRESHGDIASDWYVDAVAPEPSFHSCSAISSHRFTVESRSSSSIADSRCTVSSRNCSTGLTSFFATMSVLSPGPLPRRCHVRSSGAGWAAHPRRLPSVPSSPPPTGDGREPADPLSATVSPARSCWCPLATASASGLLLRCIAERGAGRSGPTRHAGVLSYPTVGVTRQPRGPPPDLCRPSWRRTGLRRPRPTPGST